MRVKEEGPRPEGELETQNRDGEPFPHPEKPLQVEQEPLQAEQESLQAGVESLQVELESLQVRQEPLQVEQETQNWNGEPFPRPKKRLYAERESLHSPFESRCAITSPLSRFCQSAKLSEVAFS
jgi:hypothetical protein